MGAFDEMRIQYGFASLSESTGGLGGSIRLLHQPQWEQGLLLDLRQEAGSFGRYQTSARAEAGSGRWRSQTGAYLHSARNDFSYRDITQSGLPEARLQHSLFRQGGVYQNLYGRFRKDLLSLKSWYNGADRMLPPPLTGNPERYDRIRDRML